MSQKNGNRYPIELKKKVVNLYHDGKPVAELSREYNISTVAIYKWIQNFTSVPVAQNKKKVTKNTQDRQALLEERIDQLETENEILKKATAIFAESMKKSR